MHKRLWRRPTFWIGVGLSLLLLLFIVIRVVGHGLEQVLLKVRVR